MLHRSMGRVASFWSRTEARADPNSDSIRRAREVEIARLDSGNHDRLTHPSGLGRAHPLWPPQHLEVVEQEDRRLVPPHVLHRTRHLAVLDEKCPVACETCI